MVPTDYKSGDECIGPKQAQLITIQLQLEPEGKSRGINVFTALLPHAFLRSLVQRYAKVSSLGVSSPLKVFHGALFTPSLISNPAKSLCTRHTFNIIPNLTYSSEKIRLLWACS